jgi:probable addiction module antidote protein
MALKTTKFDPADYLDNEEARAVYLSEALATDDPAFIADALGVVARAKGMTAVAKSAKVSRESLYRSLKSNGNPEFGTILKVFGALGLKLTVSSLKTKIVVRRSANAKLALPTSIGKKTNRRTAAARPRSPAS